MKAQERRKPLQRLFQPKCLRLLCRNIRCGAYSSVDMVASLCKLMSRGAIISMFVVIFVLPSFFVVFDKVIRYTSIGFGQKDKKEKAKNVAYASADTYRNSSDGR